MNSEGPLAGAVARITPDSLRDVILALSARQSPDTRSAVSVVSILEAVAGDTKLDDGPDGWRAQLALKKAVRETLKAIPDMCYIEGDS